MTTGVDHPAAPPAPADSPGSAEGSPGSAEGCFRLWARRLGPAGPLAAAMVAMPVVGGLLLLGFVRQLGPWLRDNASAGTVLLVTASFAVLGGFSLVPTYALEIVAGWAFGPVVGLFAAVVGLTAASVISFGVARLVVRGRVLDSARESPRCEAVREAMVGGGLARATLLVALLRMAPVVPFGATNVLMASAGCGLAPFALGSALGTLPRTAIIVTMASRMAELDFRQRPGVFVGSVIATLVVLAVLGYLAKRTLAQVTGGAG